MKEQWPLFHINYTIVQDKKTKTVPEPLLFLFRDLEINLLYNVHHKLDQNEYNFLLKQYLLEEHRPYSNQEPLHDHRATFIIADRELSDVGNLKLLRQGCALSP